MQSGGQHLREILAAIGEPSRFQIVLELAARERHVSDLAQIIGLSQSCTTRHLQALERAGVVRTRRAGKRVMATLAPDRESVAGLLGWLGRELGSGKLNEPGRTGGRDARHVVPQDAPPRQEPRGPSGKPRRVRRPAAGEPGGDPQAVARARGVGGRSQPAQVPAHAAPDASGTPPPPSPESTGTRPLRAGDLEDFLL